MAYFCKRISMRGEMKYKMKLQIGEFSKLCGVTVKTLRFYEKKGLLFPAEIDENTGYRYYYVSQFQQMQTISGLKKSGFSLDEISEILESESCVPAMELIETKLRQTEEQLRKVISCRDRLQSMLDSQKKIKKMEKISIQSIPEMVVASHRATIKDYSVLGELCVNVIGPEMQRLGCECPEPGYCYTFNHNKEYRDHDIDMEYCEQVSEAKQDSDIIKFKRIPAIPIAICMKVHGPYDRLNSAFYELLSYVEKEGYRITQPPRANYVDGVWNQSDPEKWLTILQVPVEKQNGF